MSAISEYREMGDSWPKAIRETLWNSRAVWVLFLHRSDHSWPAVRPRDMRLASAMIAHAIMKDEEAVMLLALEHDDPAALAAAVARAARNVLVMTSLRPNESRLFELEQPYRYAQWLAQDGAEEI